MNSFVFNLICVLYLMSMAVSLLTSAASGSKHIPCAVPKSLALLPLPCFSASSAPKVVHFVDIPEYVSSIIDASRSSQLSTTELILYKITQLDVILHGHRAFKNAFCNSIAALTMLSALAVMIMCLSSLQDAENEDYAKLENAAIKVNERHPRTVEVGRHSEDDEILMMSVETCQESTKRTEAEDSCAANCNACLCCRCGGNTDRHPSSCILHTSPQQNTDSVLYTFASKTCPSISGPAKLMNDNAIWDKCAYADRERMISSITSMLLATAHTTQFPTATSDTLEPGGIMRNSQQRPGSKANHCPSQPKDILKLSEATLAEIAHDAAIHHQSTIRNDWRRKPGKFKSCSSATNHIYPDHKSRHSKAMKDNPGHLFKGKSKRAGKHSKYQINR